ncbi:MAG: hypothetical protein V1875_09865 [Candidatus Altiarchaeota archaeon]
MMGELQRGPERKVIPMIPQVDELLQASDAKSAQKPAFRGDEARMVKAICLVLGGRAEEAKAVILDRNIAPEVSAEDKARYLAARNEVDELNRRMKATSEDAATLDTLRGQRSGTGYMRARSLLVKFMIGNGDEGLMNGYIDPYDPKKDMEGQSAIVRLSNSPRVKEAFEALK